ncbi:hypothetical protein DYB35_008472 [Aphanomyces astaci]|uniref:Protein kinase domain-containing protein n=1 Tax=Aphanomyces astaci TaxID=112090 RepID=A0A3R6ZFB6_APHAT|nr:hypothetical protein DYB35_008472 [Aphanomyces astaci]
MTVGRIPFDGKTTDALYKKVLGGAFDIPSTVSPELRDLMSAILVVDANDRMRVEHIRHHTWLGMENQHVLSSEISSSLFVANAALHSEILAEMDGYGLNRMQLHDDLASKTYNAATTWYRLLHLRHLKSTKTDLVRPSRLLQERRGFLDEPRASVVRSSNAITSAPKDDARDAVNEKHAALLKQSNDFLEMAENFKLKAEIELLQSKLGQLEGLTLN